jgi:glutaredoxin
VICLRGKLHPATHASSRAAAKHKPQNKTNMKTKAQFYHAGCPVCVAAEQNLAAALDPARYDVEIIHLGQAKQRVTEAERAGVKSVPALVLDGQPYHINFGASLDVLK